MLFLNSNSSHTKTDTGCMQMEFWHTRSIKEERKENVLWVPVDVHIKDDCDKTFVDAAILRDSLSIHRGISLQGTRRYIAAPHCLLLRAGLTTMLHILAQMVCYGPTENYDILVAASIVYFPLSGSTTVVVVLVIVWPFSFLVVENSSYGQKS